jgi:two-component system sensor histidine kinase QseC
MMIRSIRSFLLISLLLILTLSSSLTSLESFLFDKHILQESLDKKLTEIAYLCNLIHQTSLLKENNQQISSTKLQDNLINYNANLFMPTLFFQLWQNDQKLLSYSTKITHFHDAPLGFSDQIIANKKWRVYVTKNNILHTKIIVAEQYTRRKYIAHKIALNSFYVVLISYPLIYLLIWLIVSLALKTITTISAAIARRDFTFLAPVIINESPIEIQPIVTELNNLLSRLQLAFERNKKFTANAAHELRTPLAALKTHSQVALKSANLAERNQALQQIIASVDRCAHIVSQLLTLSRVEEGQITMTMTGLELSKITENTVANLVPLAIAKNIEVALCSTNPEIIIKGNETALGILISNIVSNAIRYTPKNGYINISITHTKSTAILTVVDNGPGINPELHDKVFDRFFRVPGSHTEGSGLGLAIVKQIAALHKAQITLSNCQETTGLIFTVTFPRYA